MKTSIQMNTWRIATTAILLSLLCCLIACDPKSEPEQKVPNYDAEMTEIAIKLASCLTDNYAEGDSVFFLRETGETEGFIVKLNYFTKHTQPADPNVDGGEGEILVGYGLCTFLENEKNSLHVRMDISGMWYRGIEISGELNINHKSQYTFSTKEEGDTIFLISTRPFCTLVKNVGIMHAEQNGNTWDVIHGWSCLTGQ